MNIPEIRGRRSFWFGLAAAFAAALIVVVFVALVRGDTTGDGGGQVDAGGIEEHAGEESHAESGQVHAAEGVVHLASAELAEFGIELRTAAPGELVTTKTFPGEVHVNEERYAHVVPRVSGVVRDVRVSLGDRVEAGQVMAVIESREVAHAKADYLAELARAELAETTFEREERLYEKEITSEQSYLEVRQALAEARIRLRAARQALRALGFSAARIEGLPEASEASLIRYPVTAPISGTVIDRHIVRGEKLTADTDAFAVADLSSVWVDLSIYQRDMALVREGQQVVISAAGRTGRGTISYVRPIIGEDTRTALARVVLPNSRGRWKPGMFVNGAVTVGRIEAAVVVPKSALQTVNGETVVLLEAPEGFVARPVTIGEESEGFVVISSGLEAGDVYAATGTFTLKAQLAKGSFEAGHSH